MPLVNPPLSPGMSAFLKAAYELNGHVSLEGSTPEEKRDARWLAQEHYARRVPPHEYVLLPRGWEYVERNRLVDAALIRETGRIWREALVVRSHPEDEIGWIRGLMAEGIDEQKIKRMLETLMLAGMLAGVG